MKVNIYLILLLLLISCSQDDNYTPLFPEEGEELSGGETTVFESGQGAFGFAARNLTNEEQLAFGVGNSLFNQNWVTAPASTTARDGLGPLFNARACSVCHFKDGRGRAPNFEGELNHGLLLRISLGNDIFSGPIPDPNYGGQIQDQSILDIDTEAGFTVLYQEISDSYPDGTSYSLRKPNYQIVANTQGIIQASNISPRVANQIIGLGLLESISESDLLANVDESDTNQDGVSGRVNMVWNVESEALEIGRFGWKANQPTLKHQNAAAFAGDLGITSELFPEDECPPSVDCSQIPNGGEFEIISENLDKVTFYTSTLAVPRRRNWDDQEVLEGKNLFNQVNCTSCHISKYTTGNHSIAALSNQTIYPYTDLLLHDMGEGLADNFSDFAATGTEWRTPPLWGIGLFQTVNSHTNYLHDGRARNLEEAILWHGGEALSSKNAFMALEAIEREKIILFLNTL